MYKRQALDGLPLSATRPLTIDPALAPAGFRAYVDAANGAQFLYPIDWLPPMTQEGVTFTANISGTAQLQARAYPGWTSDLAALQSEALGTFGPVSYTHLDVYKRQVSALGHLALRYLKPHRDPFLLPVYVLLSGWGLLLQDRLAPNFLGRQTLWYVLAMAALLVVAVAPRSLKPLMRYRYVLLLGGLVLVAITLVFGVNPSGGGAALWLPIPAPVLGIVYFQPSELLKVLLVIFLASYFTEQEPLYRYGRHTACLLYTSLETA